jgi:hypothetical protein
MLGIHQDPNAFCFQKIRKKFQKFIGTVLGRSLMKKKERILSYSEPYSEHFGKISEKNTRKTYFIICEDRFLDKKAKNLVKNVFFGDAQTNLIKSARTYQNENFFAIFHDLSR